jgi:hypothetical protein
MSTEPTPLVPRREREPDERFESRLNVRIGRQRIAVRVAVEARDVTDAAGPAEVIEMPKRAGE